MPRRRSDYPAASITTLICQRKIATMPELMAALGTDARRTVFRKLKALSCRTSYSHRGRYYTLDDVAEFDERGLWAYEDVWFSVHGTLLSTAASMVEAAEMGCFVEELDNVLHVGTKDALPKLVRDGSLTREEVGGRFLYCSGDAELRRRQLLGRRARLAEPGSVGPLPDAAFMPDELRAAIILFFSLLDEKQRRLYAGLEALKSGRGGDVRIAELLGLDPGTVARGRRDLLDQDVEVDRVRRAGGGRKPVEKNAGGDRAHRRPDGVRDCWRPHDRAQVDRQDHRRRRRRTSRTGDRGQPPDGLSATQADGLLPSRQPQETAPGLKTPPEDRNAQFEHIAELREDFAAHGMPLISIDTKKKELVGLFKNPGVAWSREPVEVNDHDFPSDAIGKAVPYGIYDLQANHGTVFVGTSRDTAEFAVDAIERWWRDEGRLRYPDAPRLGILADGGGGNGSRNRAWKHRLYHQIAERYGINVTVAHYPPGASKWNPIEHRLFSEISKNWAGRPLDTYETVLNYIRTTTTKTGLLVDAHLIDRQYDKGVKITDAQMSALPITWHESLPRWNYTLTGSRTDGLTVCPT